MCRRTAERELRQTKARLQHYQRLVAQLNVDVAAFGSSTADDPSSASLGRVSDHSTASQAVARAAGVLAFAGNDPLAQELRRLHDAVQPLLTAATPDLAVGQ